MHLYGATWLCKALSEQHKREIDSDFARRLVYEISLETSPNQQVPTNLEEKW